MLKRIVRWFCSESAIHEFIYRAYNRIQTQHIRCNGFIFDVSHPRLYYRARHFADQEPELLRWLNDVVKSGDVFFDVGANIGHVSLHAARLGAKVYAFEPESMTIASLNRNIYINKMSGQVTAVPIALGEATTISSLYMRDFIPGNAYNTFGRKIDYKGHEFNPVFEQGAVCCTGDDVVGKFGLPMPCHIKIDVDGNEALVIKGMSLLLQDKQVRTICIEMTPAFHEHAGVLEFITSAGFAEQKGYENASREQAGTKNHYFRR